MAKGFFIIGTDTGIGKTFVAAGILKALNAMGHTACPMKPVETGCRIRKGQLVPDDALKLLKASGLDEPLDAVNPYSFRHALAPSAAAEREDVVISKRRIISGYKKLARKHDFVIVEGAGGLMVPVHKKYLFIDLIKEMNIPLIIVARPGLGTINHTLLTLEAAREKGIRIKGVIFNHLKRFMKDLSVKSNPDMISRIGRVDILGEVPFAARGYDKKIFKKIAERIISESRSRARR